jgi:hypothetical protein
MSRSTGGLELDRGQLGQEKGDKLSIPLLARASHQRLVRFIWTSPNPIGPVARERVICVADRNDSSKERNLVAG